MRERAWVEVPGRRKQAEHWAAEALLLQEALNKDGRARYCHMRGLPLLEAGRSHSTAQDCAYSGSPPGCGRPTRPGTSAQRLPGRWARTAAERVPAARPGRLIWPAAWPAAPLPLAAPFRRPAIAAHSAEQEAGKHALRLVCSTVFAAVHLCAALQAQRSGRQKTGKSTMRVCRQPHVLVLHMH